MQGLVGRLTSGVGGGRFERIFVFLSQSEALICLNKAVNKEICVFMCLADHVEPERGRI